MGFVEQRSGLGRDLVFLLVTTVKPLSSPTPSLADSPTLEVVERTVSSGSGETAREIQSGFKSSVETRTSAGSWDLDSAEAASALFVG